MPPLNALPLPRPAWRLAAATLLIIIALAFGAYIAYAQSPPDAPSHITVNRSDGSLNASWPAVPNAATYHITYSSDSGKNWSLAALNHTTNSISITGVDNFKFYIVGVRARNSTGDSAWRNSNLTDPYIPPPKPPGAPKWLSAEGNDKSVTLRWNKAPGDVTGYQFRFREYPGPGWGDWYTVPDGDRNTTHYTIRGLKNGTEYRFKLRAVNSGVVGTPAPTSAPWYVSATPNPNVQPPPPPKPPSAPPAPSSVTATRINGNIVASWYHSEGATGYDVRYSADNGSTWKFVAWGWNTKVITIKGASTDNSYIVGVRAVNLVGASDWTNSNTVAALSKLTATNVTTSTATLTISNYNSGDGWRYKATAGPHATCQGPASGTSVNLTGLTAGESYTYSAYNDSDSSCGNTLATAAFTTSGSVSVSNLDKPAYVHNSPIHSKAWLGMGFTTGTSTAGYTLTEVTAKFGSKTDLNNLLGDIVVSLHATATSTHSEGDGKNPASATLATLSGDNPDTAGEYTYTCSGSGCALATSTTYFIQFKATAGTGNNKYYLSKTDSDGETLTPSGNGWSLANGLDGYWGDSGGWIGELTASGRLKVSAMSNPIVNP